ncbi:DUF5829 family protein [Flavobacterium nackdongense]|uniref:Uncharacterized protein n=1 Tax=Flavobacterium nackdongense TaxID=2547394 RepID=A0A4V1AGS2_9FLAO|nr:DUF5829 family protein [Flavobacterium nackdongense]QBN19032.1 hypothetical protein E1750_09535 [Flavobacterium nackdongense]
MKFIIITLLVVNVAFTQQRKLPDCNTIILCIDSETYNNIFTNSFIKDTLFICKEISTTTNKESYKGKYFIGKSATLELFQPNENGKFGDKFGDIGIEFKTKKIGEQLELIKKARKQGIALITDQIKLEDSIPWYSSIKLHDNKTNLELSTIEYRSEYLEYLGFDKYEITHTMTYESFNKKLSKGRTYPREFSKFESINIKINTKDLKLLEEFCLLNNMRKKRNAFGSKDFTIYYTIDETMDTVEIVNLKLRLINTYKNREINISKKVVLKINKKSGTFFFN